MYATRELDGAQLDIAQNPIAVPAGESRSGEFEISIAPRLHGELVSHFTIVAGAENIPMTFLAPAEEK